MRPYRAIYYFDLVAYSMPIGDQVRVFTGLEFGGLNAALDYSLIYKKAQKAAQAHVEGEIAAGTEWLGSRPSMPEHGPVIGHSLTFANA